MQGKYSKYWPDSNTGSHQIVLQHTQTNKKNLETFPATLPVENPPDAGYQLRCTSYPPPSAVKGCPAVGAAGDHTICKGKEDRRVVSVE